jgi:hypothetical protein
MSIEILVPTRRHLTGHSQQVSGSIVRSGDNLGSYADVSLSLCDPFVALARLVIGFITYLRSTASGITSTDGAIRRMER